MVTIVNGRVVRNIEINRCIQDSYHTYKPDDKYPIVVLNISVDTTLTDVNIHPTKQDIKFGKLEELKELISSTIIDALNKIRLIPKIENKEEDIPVLNKVITPIKEDTKEIEDTKNKYEEISLNLEFKEEESKYNEEYKEELNEEDKKVPMMYPVGLVKGTYIVLSLIHI